MKELSPLEEIEHKLSLLPEYLEYRADKIIERHFIWDSYLKQGILYASLHIVMSFDEWFDKQSKLYDRSKWFTRSELSIKLWI